MKTIILFLIGAIMSFNSFGMEFDDLFTEAMGLGGSYNSVVYSPSSAFFNPASLYYFKDSDKYLVSINYGISVYEAYDFMGFTDSIGEIINRLDNGWQKEDADSLIGILDNISYENPSLYGNSGYSFIISKGSIAVHYNEKNISDIIFDIDEERVLWASANDPNSIFNNMTNIQFHGIKIREYGISYATLLDENLFFGTTFRFITADTYYDTLNIFGIRDREDKGIKDYIDYAFDESRKDSSAYTFDAGLIMKLGDWGSLGFTAKNLRKIDIESEYSNLQFNTQYRIGLTILLSANSFFSIDRDLTSNETLIEGKRSKKLSIGLQASFFDNNFILRAGGRRDTHARDSKWKYYLGTGIRIADYMEIQGAFLYSGNDDSFGYSIGMNLVL